MIKKIILILFVLSVATLLGVGNYLSKLIQSPLAFKQDEVNYQVKSGASLKRVLNDFEKLGWLEQPRVHEYWLRHKQMTRIQKGEYVFRLGMTSTEVVQKMIEGKKVLRSIQFIEGKRFTDYLDVLANNAYVEQTLSDKSLQEITQLVSSELKFYEGWFFPDTYLFEKGTTDLDLLKKAHQRMRDVLKEEWAKRSKDTVVQSPYEALILASIIEKETGAAFERPMISSVFTRRMEQGMRLQTDPTVIYGLGEQFDGNLTRSHLRMDTPYNTYTRKGLPPTPIANPGREAIAAALNPTDDNFIFFVAKGDGTHHFSTTLAEHNAAVRKYQRFGRRNDYQSAPATTEDASE